MSSLPILRALCAALPLFLCSVRGEAVDATYNSASDVPVTAASYTATGNTVSFTLNHTPAIGENLIVVKNTGLAFIQGTFGNLSQGQKVSLAYAGINYQFVANYYGGTGNDLVLQWGGPSITAWGSNSNVLLGVGGTTTNSVPVAVATTGALSSKTVMAASAGSGYSLGCCSDGTLAAWGANTDGRLGNNSNMPSSVPVAVDVTGALSGKAVVAVAAGSRHSLALCSDGTVVAWGKNSAGQLGNNSTTDSSVPVAVDTTGVLSSKAVVAVSVGQEHSLALCSDGTVVAWGWNGNGGQLGNGGGTTSSSVPVPVNTTGALSGKTVVAVSAGGYHSLALCSDGTVAAWGNNNYGQLGDNSTTSRGVPVAVNGTGILSGKTVTAVAAGGYQSLALCSDGTVVAWGQNSAGQLGNNSTTDRSVPVAVDTTGVLGSKAVVAVSVGQEHSLALCSDGTVVAWGRGQSGQLGNNRTANSSVPVAVDIMGVLSGKTVVAVSAGSSHSLAVCSDGMVAAWGGNSSGQLGNNQTVLGYVPVAVESTGILNGKTVVAIAAGYQHSLALSSNGTVAAWGDGNFFQLGSMIAQSSVPVAVNGILGGKTVVTAAAGGYHSLALCSDGTVAAWGWAWYGQLGNGSYTSMGVPVAVNTTGILSAKSVVAVAAGGYHSLALCSDGTVAAWGYNNFGQLGINSSGERYVPVAVNTSGVLSGKTVVAVSAGYSHSLALCSDGTVAAWGYNVAGQLGNNSTANSYVPVAVSSTGVLSGKTVVAVSAGYHHSLALCSDGTVAAWGRNGEGQLGDNSTVQSSVPVAVATSSFLSGKTVVAVSAGSSHSLALCSDGTVAAWGTNGTGLLGNNNATNSLVPVGVSSTGVLNGKTVVAVSSGLSHSLALAAGLSNVSTLSGLALSSNSLSPSFASGTYTYTADVPIGTASITVTPTVTDSTATVRVNGSLIASGSASSSIPLTESNNPITVLVTAQDGVTATTYTITVRTTAYETWKAAAFTNQADRDNPAVSGPNASPAGDGITNLMKYALALPPLVCGTGDLPKPAVQDGYLTLTYRRNQQATDATYTVEACDSLDGNWSATNAVISQVDKGGYWEVTVRDSMPIAGNPRRFMRLKVSD